MFKSIHAMKNAELQDFSVMLRERFVRKVRSDTNRPRKGSIQSLVLGDDGGNDFFPRLLRGLLQQAIEDISHGEDIDGAIDWLLQDEGALSLGKLAEACGMDPDVVRRRACRRVGIRHLLTMK